jgi:hypothetical protein
MSLAGVEIGGAAIGFVFGAVVAQAAGLWLSLCVNPPFRIGCGVLR